MDSGTTEQLVMDNTVVSMNKESSKSAIGTASGNVLRWKSEGASESPLPRCAGPVRQDRILHGPKRADSLISITDLYDDEQSVQLTKNNCFIKTKKKAVGDDRRMDEIYAVDFKKVRK